MKKRLLSLFLCVVLIFGGVVTVSAENTNSDISADTGTENVTGEIITLYDYNHYKEYDILVICFDSKYSVKGDAPIVNLDTYRNVEKDRLYTRTGISEKSITQELFVYEGVNYPQIFITVPIDFDYKDSKTYITIQEGVFLTADGEKSNKVEIPYTALDADSSRDRIKLSCKGDAVTDVSSKPIRILQDSTVSAEGTFNGKYADVWAENAKISFEYMDTVIEGTDNTVTAENDGTYKVKFALNDQLYITKSFQSVSQKNRYLENLKEKTEAFFLSPIAFVVSLVMFIFVPGFGTWIGSTSMLASVYAIPNFFIALFGSSLSGEYVF